ncbi:phycoerythrobilin:ferredoxin oxidoreductase [Synechococcus sp. 1G10]|uniref:phycoerythrobilin:ferredoxin oxidoreductase n=1 Tax=Synechococcus sp. 1G10 TaxID=2025605 RepID=UPI000B991B99|nr:phycoerythrobilin:ferredoxin oxidoreductase [Synechococcus sp. 1G10]
MTPSLPTHPCSLDPVTLPRWRWGPFLDHAVEVLQPLRPEAYPIEPRFLRREGVTGSKAHPVAVTTSTWACRTDKLRQVRAACVEAGMAASVLNFVANPSSNFDLPFFGADLVTLPSGHLIALDLQPALKKDQAHTMRVWERLVPLWENWTKLLPSGGPIPSEAEPYFSPGFLWTRLPLGEQGDELIRSAVFPAFVAYFDLYLQLVAEATPVEEKRCEELLAGQQRYVDYRAEKDPARGMLTRFHGAEWTEAYIHEVLFDL